MKSKLLKVKIFIIVYETYYELYYAFNSLLIYSVHGDVLLVQVKILVKYIYICISFWWMKIKIKNCIQYFLSFFLPKRNTYKIFKNAFYLTKKFLFSRRYLIFRTSLFPSFITWWQLLNLREKLIDDNSWKLWHHPA